METSNNNDREGACIQNQDTLFVSLGHSPDRLDNSPEADKAIHAEPDSTKVDWAPAFISSLSVVFPALNEEANIERTVELAREVIAKYAEDIEIIVVNDGSSDRTGEILDSVAKRYSEVHVVHHKENRGYGAALRSGINVAEKQYIFFSDSDLQFDLDEIRHHVHWIGEKDIVMGYRINRADSLHRRLNAWGWNMLVRTVLGVYVRDIDCAFKLFRRDVFDIIELESVGAMINTEILANAQKHNMRLQEVPVSHYPRTLGEQTGANPRVILKAFRELFSMYRKLGRGVAPAKKTDTLMHNQKKASDH